jgi:multimeric flavodoxin WrbA
MQNMKPCLANTTENRFYGLLDSKRNGGEKMKVVLINGSPRKNGCTARALREVETQLQKNGIETEWFHVGNKPISGCIACGACKKTGRCAVSDDVNQCAALIADADGLVVGSPVHYAGASGAITSFMDRLFYSASKQFQFKPAAAVVSCRRGGASATFDQLNKYFTINNMPIVSSQYWNSVHGNTPEEVEQDLEGLQTMRTLGNNMAWLIRCIDQAKDKVPYPEKETKVSTNFIR